MLYEMNMSYLEFYNTCRNMYNTHEFLGFKLKLEKRNCFDIDNPMDWEQPQNSFLTRWSVWVCQNNDWLAFPYNNGFSKTSVALASVIPFLIYMHEGIEVKDGEHIDFDEYFKDKKDSVEEYYEQYKEIMAKLKHKGYY